MFTYKLIAFGYKCVKVLGTKGQVERYSCWARDYADRRWPLV